MTTPTTAVETYTHTPQRERHALTIARALSEKRSEHTRAAYRRDIAAFLDTLDVWGVQVEDVRREHLNAYREHLKGMGRAASTVNRALSGASVFLDFLTDEGTLDRNPAARMTRERVDSAYSTTQALTAMQAHALIDAAAASSPRDYALIVLLLHTGARISEVLGADVEDIGHDAARRVLRVTRKGGHRAALVLSPRAVEALGAYLGEDVANGTAVLPLDALMGAHRPLFTTRTGARLTRDAAARTVRTLARRAGISGHVSPHTLRHTHATLALDAGAALHDVQDSLGHADPRTTRRYDHARGRLDRSTANVVGRLL